jgi:hypothetical protein
MNGSLWLVPPLLFNVLLLHVDHYATNQEYQTSFQDYTRIIISIAFLTIRGFSMVNQLQVRFKEIELSRNV